MSYKHDGAGMSPAAFKNIITERTAEVREQSEQKRLIELRRTQEMKSKTGVHPLQIFPKEVRIWQMIFNKLRPEDRGNMWELHEVFQDIMQTSRIRDILLPQIVKFKIKRCWIAEEEEENLPYGQTKEDVIPFAHYLPIRLVSRSMRNAVDSFLEENLLESIPPTNPTEAEAKITKTATWGFRNIPEDINHLHRVCSDVKSNSRLFRRLPTRSLSIDIFDDHDPEFEFLQRFEQLKAKLLCYLRLIGEEIWHFKFDCSHFYGFENGLDQVYIAFIECLSLLPNLRWLHLYIDCKSENACGCDELQLRFVESQPPPKLLYLLRIDLGDKGEDVSSDATVSFYRAILAAYPHVKHLQMIRGDDVLTCNEHLRLESLFLWQPDDYCGEDDEDLLGYRRNDFYAMEKMIKVSWPLQRIKMLMDLKHDSIFPVFKFLEKFPTLELVSLVIKNVTIGGGIDFLVLPNLQELDLQFDPTILTSAPVHFFFSLQFLIYCKNLKKLRWCDESSYSEDTEQLMKKNCRNMIAFRGGRGYLNSKRINLWQILPHLEFVHANVHDKDEDGRRARFLWEYNRSELL